MMDSDGDSDFEGFTEADILYSQRLVAIAHMSKESDISLSEISSSEDSVSALDSDDNDVEPKKKTRNRVNGGRDVARRDRAWKKFGVPDSCRF